jgi:hypothetical protein
MFKNAMLNNINNENGCCSKKTTGNACTNLFFKLCRDLKDNKEQLHQLLSDAWSEDAQITIKIIFQTRDCRGGKGERELFYMCYIWLIHNHIEVATKNIKYITEYGSYRDIFKFLNIKYVIDREIYNLIINQIHEDLNIVHNSTNSNDKKNISLLGKWLPNEKKERKIVYSIMCNLYPDLENNKTSKGKSKVYRMYRKEITTPLRNYINIAEIHMCNNTWEDINLEKIPSRCLFTNKYAFECNMTDTYNKYIEDVQNNKKKINTNQLFPHELVNKYMDNYCVQSDPLINEQWRSLEEKLHKSCLFKNSLAMCDVSGSMSGIPMSVSIALGLLVSRNTNEEYRNLVITFSESPEFFEIKGETLYERARELSKMKGGMNTDFEKCYLTILNNAIKNHISNDNMVKNIFVFSDMQFDIANNNNWNTSFENMQIEFRKHNYDLPHMIFWNLRGDTIDFPTNAGQIGVTLMSGYSSELMKYILTSSSIADINPYKVLLSIVNDPRYDEITI